MMEAKKLCLYLWSTLRADLPSSMHKEAWMKFKENLRLRDSLALSVGMSNEILGVVLGTDQVTKVRNFMEDESNLKALPDKFTELWPYTSVFNRICIIMMVCLLIISFRCQKTTTAIFYIGVIYLMNESLLILPGGFAWYANPSTKLVTMIFSFIDRSVPQSIAVLIFWTF